MQIRPKGCTSDLKILAAQLTTFCESILTCSLIYLHWYEIANGVSHNVKMLSTGIPELRSANDIKYLREHMSLSMKDQDASAFFKQKIEESLKSKRTQFNDFAHMWKNKKKNSLLDKFIFHNIGFL